jgi:tetratricopeptide (TPR) repeat protein
VTGIALPGEDRLPPGPHRDFLEALHALYDGAGKPGLRLIAAATADGEYRSTISHENAGALLRGTGLPRWLKVDCVVRQLAEWHNPRLDPDEEAARFNALWLAAERARTAGAATPTAPQVPAAPGVSPTAVRGRDEIIGRLSRGLEPGHYPWRPHVLAGPAGIGKSTIACRVADIARSKGRAWWVCAADEERLSRDLADVARDLKVSEADWARLGSRPVADLTDVADRVWEALESEQQGWLLVIDNADTPRLLGPQDGTGWIRQAAGGLMLITTRDADKARWPEAELIGVGPLEPEAAARVLTDLAPTAGDRVAARTLAQRLGNVPLSLKLAGMYLRQDLGSRHTFDEYRGALEHADTSEISLDALGRAGFHQARPLLWLLACYAPASLIPEEIVTSDMTPARLPDPRLALPAGQLAESCRSGLRELESAGLIDRSGAGDGRSVIRVHPWIAEAARAVMDNGQRSPGGLDPDLVRASAAATACAFVGSLDTGSAGHWSYFRVMAPHVEELLLHTAGRLAPRGRRDLLACMVRCIAAHTWSKAERRAEQLSLRAMARAAELGCQDQDVYLRLRHVYALARREQGCLAEAAGEFRDILPAQLRTGDGATRLDTLRTRQQLAWTLGRLGRWAEAEAGLREVIRLLDARQRERGAEGQDARVLRLHVRCMINWCVGRQGRWAEAEHGYRQLVTDREETLGADHPDTLDAGFNIGKALAWQGKWAAAENAFQHSTSDRVRALGDHHPDTLLARQLLLYAGGYLARQNGDRRGIRMAAAGLEMVLSAQRDKRGDDHRETRETLALLTALRGDYSPSTMWPEDLPRPDEE